MGSAGIMVIQPSKCQEMQNKDGGPGTALPTLSKPRDLASIPGRRAGKTLNLLQ